MCKQCIKSIEEIVNRHLNRHPDLPVADCFGYLLAEIKQINKCPAMRILEELTPGGSEFYEDPVYCGMVLRERRASNHKLLVNTVTEKKDLRAICDLLPISQFDDDMSNVDAAQFVDNANSFFEAMTAYKAYKKEGK